MSRKKKKNAIRKAFVEFTFSYSIWLRFFQVSNDRTAQQGLHYGTLEF